MTRSQASNMENKNLKILPAVFLALAGLVVFRSLFLLKAPLSNFGYDYGFYLYAINHLDKISFNTFTAAISGEYSNLLFYLTSILRLPATIVLNELYFLFAVLLGISFLYLFKANRRAGVMAILLTAFSLIQAEAYSMFLWKNVIALPLLVLSFKFIMEKRYLWLAIASLGILITHRTTAVIYLLTLAIFAAYTLIRQHKYRLLGISAGALLILLVLSLPAAKLVIQNLIFNKNSYVSTGLFLEEQNIWLLLWPSIALAAAGFYLYVKNRQHPLLPIFTLLCLLWLVFQLPFYRRFLIYLDISLIFYAAYFLGNIKYNKLFGKLALGGLLVFLAYRAADFVLAKQPLILPAETREIQTFHQPGFVLAVTANDAPWLLGYSQNVRLGAPGLFEDPHTYEEWANFWRGINQKDFLDAYPQPLYLYQRSYQIQGPITQCLKPLSENYFYYFCPN